MSSVLEIVRERLPAWFKLSNRFRYSRRSKSSERRPSQRRVKLYMPAVDDRRIQELRLSCELLAEGFENIETWLKTYVQEFQCEQCSSAEEDIENFLNWLAGQGTVSDEQKDFIIYQRANLSVEYVVLARKLAHARFQAMLESCGSRRDAGEISLRWRIHLNPVRILATLETYAIVDELEVLPAKVLFYPVAGEVRSVVVDAASLPIITLLANGSMSLNQIAQRVDQDWDELFDRIQDLALAGVLAYGSYR